MTRSPETTPKTDTPRRKRRGGSVMAWVGLAIIVTSFGGYGISSYSGGRMSIGSVGDTPIDANRYARALQNRIAELGQQVGQPLSFAQAQQFGIDGQVRQNLVTSYALDNEAARIGLSVGDRVLADEIMANPAFRGASGQFDRAIYDETLRRSGMTAPEFDATVREDVARSILSGAVAGGFIAPAPVTDTLVDYIAERRSVSVLQLTDFSLTEPPATPDDAALRAYYDAHPDRFTRPEAKRITYAALLPEALAATMTADDTELRKIYDEFIGEFVKPERRLVERLVFGSEADAMAARARIDAGESFDKIVEERGLRLLDIDLGDVSREELGAAGDGVFALDAPGVAGPLPSDLGPALYRMNGVLAAQEVPFEEARPILTTRWQLDAARRAIGDRREAIDDALAGGASPADLAREQGMELATIDYSDQSDDEIAGYPAFRAAALALQEGDFPETVQLDDGGLVAMQFDALVPPAPIPFDEVRDQVAEAAQADARHKALIARAEQIRTEVAAGARLATFGILDVAPELARDGVIEGAPRDVVDTAFRLGAGETALVQTADFVGLVQVDAIRPADQASADAGALKTAIAAQLDQSLAQDAFALFSAGLATGAGISFDQAAIDAVHAQMR